MEVLGLSQALFLVVFAIISEFCSIGGIAEEGVAFDRFMSGGNYYTAV